MNCSTERIAVSKASHAMTFECVKCWRSPRISQSPSSGCCHAPSEVLEQRRLHRPGIVGGVRRRRRDPHEVQRAECLAVDVELELAAGRVADVDRSRSLVSREPAELVLGEASLAVQPVHDLQLGGLPGRGSQEPAPPGRGFFVVAARHERQAA